MKILDWYLARKFLGTLIFILSLTAVVAVIFDVSERVEDFSRNDLGFFEVVFGYYIYFVPVLINLISPLIIFLAALYFTSRLASNTEFVAMLSGGISYYRLLVPYIATALLLAGADAVSKNFLIPQAYARQAEFEFKFVTQGYTVGKTNIHRQLDSNTYFYTQVFDFNNSIAYGFTIEKFKDDKLVYKLKSNNASYDTIFNVWRVKDYYIRRIDGLRETVEKGDTLTMKLDISRADFKERIKSIPALTTQQINAEIQESFMRGEDLGAFYAVEKQKRLAMPVAIVILVLIAVSVASRKIRGGLGMHLMLGILIAISYELMMRFSTTFATNAGVSPIYAVWMPNLLFGVLAVVLLIRTPK